MTIKVAITSEYITLGQLLKSENLIESGGQAKHFLADHPVELNHEPEQRRGKKLYPGDQVNVNGQSFEISGLSDQDLAEQAAIKAREKELRQQFATGSKPATKSGKREPKGPGSWN